MLRDNHTNTICQICKFLLNSFMSKTVFVWLARLVFLNSSAPNKTLKHNFLSRPKVFKVMLAKLKKFLVKKEEKLVLSLSHQMVNFT